MIVELVAATGLAVDYSQIRGVGPRDTVQLHVSVRPAASDDSRSFAFMASGGSASLTIPLPESWRGDLVYGVEIRADSGRRFRREVASPADGTARLVVTDDDELSGSTKAVEVIAQWADGLLCDKGLRCVAVLANGNKVGVPAERVGSGRYRLRVPDGADHVLIVPQDGYGGIRDGAVLAAGQLASASVCSVTMPAGVDVVVVLPDDIERTVTIAGAFGARSVLAKGRFVLRSVPNGTLSASCRVGEQELSEQIEVDGEGDYFLTLLQ